MIGIKFKGFKELNDKFHKMKNSLDKNLEVKVRQEAESIAEDARMNCPVDMGQLRGSIQTRVIKESDGISGEVFTNSDHAAFVEFGTGVQGASAGLQIEGIDLSYTMEPWFVPVEGYTGTKRPTMNGKVTIVHGKDGKQFYMTNGQRPQPYLYPAMKLHEKEIAKKLGSAVMLESKVEE